MLVRVVDLGLHALAAQVPVDRAALLVDERPEQRPLRGRRSVARLVRAADARRQLQVATDDEIARLNVSAPVAARGPLPARDLVAPEPLGLQRRAPPDRLHLDAPLPDADV